MLSKFLAGRMLDHRQDFPTVGQDSSQYEQHCGSALPLAPRPALTTCPPPPLAVVRNTHTSTLQGNAKLPGIMAVGYIAAFSETLALAVIVSKGVAPLKDVSGVAEKETRVSRCIGLFIGCVADCRRVRLPLQRKVVVPLASSLVSLEQPFSFAPAMLPCVLGASTTGRCRTQRFVAPRPARSGPLFCRFAAPTLSSGLVHLTPSAEQAGC